MIFPVQVQTMPVAPPCIRNLQVHPMMTWFDAKVSAELAKMGAFALLRAIAPTRPDLWDPFGEHPPYIELEPLIEGSF